MDDRPPRHDVVRGLALILGLVADEDVLRMVSVAEEDRVELVARQQAVVRLVRRALRRRVAGFDAVAVVNREGILQIPAA